MANETTVDTAPLLAMPTSRPSLDQVRQIIGGERSGEFAPAYMPEYAGLRGVPAQPMFMPTQFSFPAQQAPAQQAPVQQAPAPAYGRTFTELKAPELPAATTPPPQMYTGAKPVTSQKAIGQTASGELIYALPKPELKPGETLPNEVVGYYYQQPIYARPMDNPSYGAAGGLVSLARGGSVAQEAQGLASLGRGGDTMLVHMSPEEVSGLRSLALQNGTDLTINPDTGLPEAKRLKKLFRALAPILPFIPIPGMPALSLAMKSVLSGIIGGIAAPGKGFNFKEGLKTGIMAFAGGKMMEGIQAANAAQAGPGTGGNVMTDAGMTGAGGAPPPPSPATGGPTPGMYGDYTAPVEALAPAPTTTTAAPTTATTTAASPVATEAQIQAGIGGSQAGVADAALTSTPGPDVFPATAYAASAPPAAAGTAATGTASAPAGSVSAFERYTGMKPTTAMIGGSLLYGAMEGDKEQKAYEEEMARLAAEEERKRRAGSATFDVSLGRVQPSGVRTAAGGGIVALAGGGMPTFEYGGTTAPTGEPRMVRGAGDGMSDNVPATIEGVQEARLANDEFVVPADVVADIGNGSSNAGAEKLYAMMDRIRKARHGTTKQPPEINAERFMPA